MSDSINVLWLSYHQPEIIARGYWDNGLLFDMLTGDRYIHQESVDSRAPELRPGTGAIVIINGRTHTDDAQKINDDLAKLAWVLLIITGDEEALFPWREIHHPMMRLWVQLPRMNLHNDTSYKVPNGYRPNTRALLKEIGQQSRTNDFFFAGQVNHPRREQCLEAVKCLPEGMATGRIAPTTGFGQEALAYKDYLTVMAKSKIVLCPSGIETPDTFRLYEALEAGCLPVVDAFSTNSQAPGFWNYLFGDDIPFPIVDYWDKLPSLMPQLLKEYPQNANKAFAWWQQKKREIRLQIEDTVKELSR